MQTQTIPASEIDICSLCGRNHRKLFLIDGYRLGKSCADKYRFNARRKSAAYGWENEFEAVSKMISSSVR